MGYAYRYRRSYVDSKNNRHGMLTSCLAATATAAQEKREAGVGPNNGMSRGGGYDVELAGVRKA